MKVTQKGSLPRVSFIMRPLIFGNQIGCGEDAKERGHAHNHMEVADYEVSGVQVDVDGGLSEEEAAYAARDEHGNKAESEEGGADDLNPCTVATAAPHERQQGSS